ncbi:MAG: helix-turn-helix domain-containing protein [Firmicutes bacterium]|nr:helix-turn-helix domain-containing protein [Bacillota bacterium]
MNNQTEIKNENPKSEQVRAYIYKDKPPIKQILSLLNARMTAENKSLATVKEEFRLELSKTAPISPEAIRSWTIGYARPDMSRLLDIAKYFNVTTDFLLGAHKSKSVDPKVIAAGKKFGLEDIPIEQLEKLAQDKPMGSDGNIVRVVPKEGGGVKTIKTADILKVVNILLSELKHTNPNKTILGLLVDTFDFEGELEAHYKILQKQFFLDDSEITQLRANKFYKTLVRLIEQNKPKEQ